MFRINIIFLLFIFSTITAFSQPVENKISEVNTGSGLHSTDFKTKLGVLTIYLPSDLTVTEPASGTVSFKKNKSGTQDNIGINEVFTSYKLIVENQPVELTGNVFFIEVPINLPTGVLSVSLRNSEGRVVNRAFFPVRLTKRGNLPRQVGNPANFRLPVTSRSGQPARISGNFDGNLTNASVSISGTKANVLAESKKQLIFLTPSKLQGAKVLTLKERDTEVKNPFTVLYVVRVGQEQPKIYADNSVTRIPIPNKSEEVLVESGNQIGEIDLNAVNEVKPVNQLPNTSSAPQLESNEEITFGPTTSNLSKPLEIDPGELQKLRNTSPRVFSNQDLPELNGLTELNTNTQIPETIVKPIKEKPVQVKEQPKLIKELPKKVEVTDNSLEPEGKDISEIKPQIDEQLTAQFVPLDSKSKKSTPKVVESQQKETIEDLNILESEISTPVSDPVGDYITSVANAKQVTIDNKSEKDVSSEKILVKKENLKATVAQADLDQTKTEVSENKEAGKEKNKADKKKESELIQEKNSEKLEVTEDIKLEEKFEFVGPKLPEGYPEGYIVPASKTKKTEAPVKKADKTENNKQKKPAELTVTEKVELTEEIKIEEAQGTGPKLPEKGVSSVKKADKKVAADKKAEPKPDKEVAKKKAKKDEEKKEPAKTEVKKSEKTKTAKKEKVDNKKATKKDVSKEQKVSEKKTPKKTDKKIQDKQKNLKVVEKVKVTEEVKVEETQVFVGPMQPEKKPATVKKADKKVQPNQEKAKSEKLVKKAEPKKEPAKKEVKKPEAKKVAKNKKSGHKNKVAKKEVKKEQKVQETKPAKKAEVKKADEIVGPTQPEKKATTAKKEEKKKVDAKKAQPKQEKKKTEKKQVMEVKKEQKTPEKKTVKKAEVKKIDKKKSSKKNQDKPKDIKISKKAEEVEDIQVDLVGPVIPDGVKPSVKKAEPKKNKKIKKKETKTKKAAKSEQVTTARIDKKAVKKQQVNSSGAFAIQLGSFKKQSEAADLVSRLQSGGYDVYYKKFKVPGKGYWYRVRKGGFSSRQEAESYKNTLNLSQFQISSFYVTPENR